MFFLQVHPQEAARTDLVVASFFLFCSILVRSDLCSLVDAAECSLLASCCRVEDKYCLLKFLSFVSLFPDSF